MVGDGRLSWLPTLGRGGARVGGGGPGSAERSSSVSQGLLTPWTGAGGLDGARGCRPAVLSVLLNFHFLHSFLHSFSTLILAFNNTMIFHRDQETQSCFRKLFFIILFTSGLINIGTPWCPGRPFFLKPLVEVNQAILAWSF